MKPLILAVLLAIGIGAAFVAYSGMLAAAGEQGSYRSDAPTTPP